MVDSVMGKRVSRFLAVVEAWYFKVNRPYADALVPESAVSEVLLALFLARAQLIAKKGFKSVFGE
jgi:hypothetical protein